MPQPGGPRGPSALVAAFDLMATKVVHSLHQLFGFQYTRNAEHYVYSASITTGTADALGTVYNSSIRVTQEADFIATRLNGSVRISTTGILIGISGVVGVAGDLPDMPVALLITDGSSDRQLSNEPVDVFATYGTWGGLPGIWARPRLFARNTTISLQLTSLKVVPASTIWVYRIVLIGWKIYDAQALDLTSRS